MKCGMPALSSPSSDPLPVLLPKPPVLLPEVMSWESQTGLLRVCAVWRG